MKALRMIIAGFFVAFAATALYAVVSLGRADHIVTVGAWSVLAGVVIYDIKK